MKTTAKTALKRNKLSVPARWIMENRGLDDVLDYGCGKGDDVRHLDGMDGIVAGGWDPYHQCDYLYRPGPDWGYSQVLCTYVANVLLDVADRCDLYDRLAEYHEGGSDVYITVRRDGKGKTASQHFGVDPRDEHHAPWELIRETSQYAIYALEDRYDG